MSCSSFCVGMLTKLDESVGRVTAALQESGLLQNSIIVFTTDNGGPAASFDFNAASNWPLRGVSHNAGWGESQRGVGRITPRGGVSYPAEWGESPRGVG